LFSPEADTTALTQQLAQLAQAAGVTLRSSQVAQFDICFRTGAVPVVPVELVYQYQFNWHDWHSSSSKRNEKKYQNSSKHNQKATKHTSTKAKHLAPGHKITAVGKTGAGGTGGTAVWVAFFKQVGKTGAGGTGGTTPKSHRTGSH